MYTYLSCQTKLHFLKWWIINVFFLLACFKNKNHALLIFRSFLHQKSLYFQSKRPDFIPIEAKQREILKLIHGFFNITLGLDGRYSGDEKFHSSNDIIILIFNRTEYSFGKNISIIHIWSRCGNLPIESNKWLHW